MFDALPEEVRLKIKKQHAYYRMLLHQEGASKTKGRNVAERNSSQRSQHITTFVSDNPYDPGPYRKSEENSSKNDENPDEDDPIKETFNQFLARARRINICQTNKVFTVPGRANHAHFVSNSNYGRLMLLIQVP